MPEPRCDGRIHAECTRHDHAWWCYLDGSLCADKDCSCHARYWADRDAELDDPALPAPAVEETTDAR